MPVLAANNVSVNARPSDTEKTKDAVERLLGTPVEACHNYSQDAVCQPGLHALFAAADLCFRQHYPLTLTPDAVWLTIAQGFANHVNNNAEAVRTRLVKHEGKVTLYVRNDSLVKGSPETQWEEVWPGFSKQIKEHLGDETHGMLLSDFSTTDKVARAASEIVLMDSVQSYFGYTVHTLCGIPAINVEGTVEDWEKIHSRVHRMGGYDLEWWTGPLSEVTAELVKAAKGEANPTFLQGFYKESGGSGGPYINGFITQLVPYLKSRKWNSETKQQDPPTTTTPNHCLKGNSWGLTHDCLPSSVSQVPFLWDYYGQHYEYEFLGGVLTISQDADTKALKPQAGWAVRPANQRPVNPQEACRPSRRR